MLSTFESYLLETTANKIKHIASDELLWKVFMCNQHAICKDLNFVFCMREYNLCLLCNIHCIFMFTRHNTYIELYRIANQIADSEI